MSYSKYIHCFIFHTFLFLSRHSFCCTHLNSGMSLYNSFYVLFLFVFPYTVFTTEEFLLTSTNYFHHIHCNNNLHIKINSIKYIYRKYNCTLVLNDTLNICSNQSSCILNLKPFLFFHVTHYITHCRTIKLKYIRLNYTCISDTFISSNILTQPRKSYSYTNTTIIICSCIIIFVSLLAFFCSYLRHSARNAVQGQENSIVNDTHNIPFKTPSIDDNQSKQEYELKNLSLVESSSSSTLTSLNNKNIITNSSEYDNLIKPSIPLSSLNPNDIVSTQSPFKIK